MWKSIVTCEGCQASAFNLNGEINFDIKKHKNLSLSAFSCNRPDLFASRRAATIKRTKRVNSRKKREERGGETLVSRRGGAGRRKHAHVPYARTRACRLNASVLHALRVYASLAHASRMRVCVPDRLQAPCAAVSQAARKQHVVRSCLVWCHCAVPAPCGPLGPPLPDLWAFALQTSAHVAGALRCPLAPVGGPGSLAPAPVTLRASLC